MEQNVAARSGVAGWALVYLAGPTAVTLRLDRVAAGRPVTATWVDPATGLAWSTEQAGAGDRIFQPPPGAADTGGGPVDVR